MNKNLFERVWLAVAVLWALPFVALLALGGLWLYQHGWQWQLGWGGFLVVSGGLAFAGQYWLRRQNEKLLQKTYITTDPDWSAQSAAVWADVNTFADQIDPAEWPLERQNTVPELARQTLTRVAKQFHPDVADPLLELTLPHTLLIVEQAAHELRTTLTDNVPFSHQLKIGSLVRIYQWKDFINQASKVYRLGQLVINPAQAVLTTLWGYVRERGVNQVQQEFSRWLLRELVLLVGKHAIALYSGRPQIVNPTAAPPVPLTKESELALQQADTQAEIRAAVEPLRILILGRANAGKSSLINALFGKLQASTDLLPNTTRDFTPYQLQRDGLDAALIFDSPDVEQLAANSIHAAAEQADMILWITAAHRPDRQTERHILDTLRTAQTQLKRRPPPLLVVVTHIDRLRPLREWQPPYDLNAPIKNLKAQSIQAAMIALATDLNVPIECVIPISLLEGRTYNVDDALWVAMLNHSDHAQRTRLLRCQAAHLANKDWQQVGRQLLNAGRFLMALPKACSQK